MPDYSQLASERRITRARHASSAPQRPPGTPMTLRSKALRTPGTWRAGAQGRLQCLGSRGSGSARTAAQRNPRVQPEQGAEGTACPLPAPSPAGEVIMRTFPGSLVGGEGGRA